MDSTTAHTTKPKALPERDGKRNERPLPAQAVIERLEGVKKNGKGWSAKCPAHDDRNPSLSVSVNERGVCLVHCHSGCSCDAVMDAIGLPVAALFPDFGQCERDHEPRPQLNGHSKPQKAAEKAATFETAEDAIRAYERRHGEPTAKWEYHNRGQVCGVVIRFDTQDGKTFRQISRAEDGRWRMKAMDEPRPLYRLGELSGHSTVYVVEGENCADVVTAIGLPATTSPGGAKAASKADWRPLAGRDIIILPDADDAGTSCAETTASILHRLGCRVRIVNLPLPAGSGDDVADLIAEREADGKDAAAIRQELADLAERADEWQPSADDESEVAPKVRPLKLDKTDPLDSARQCIDATFIECGERTLQYHAGDFWRFDSPAYRAVEADELRQIVYRFAERAVGADGKPFKPTMRKVSDIIDAMRAETYLLPGPVPRWLNDSQLPSGELLPCANGLLHIPMRELHPATPAYLTVNALDYAYSANTPKPEHWIAFLRSLWGDDAEAVMLLQEWFGYVLTVNLSLHKMLLLCGPKRSGKGTIGRVLTAMLGAANVCGPTLSSLTERFGLAPLLHKPLAIISDARLSGRADSAIVAERLLAISGEDSITIDRKHREAVTCTLPTRFMLLTNELPRIADSSGALASRFVVLTLRRSFYGCEDTALTGKLLAELPSILNWALEGWDRLYEQGRFTEPQSSAEAIEELADLGSPAQTFIRDCCEIHDGASVACGELYDRWRRWCDSVGRDHPGDLQRFSRDLHAAASSIRTSNPLRTASGRVRFFEGIRLKESTDDLPT